VRVRRRPEPRATEETLRTFRGRLRQLIAEMRAQGLPAAAIARELAAALEAVKS